MYNEEEKNNIVSQIVSYTQDDSSKYAVMLNGQWGCGKTHLIKNRIIPEVLEKEIGKDLPKKVLYISLYGLSSIDELSKEILFKNCVFKFPKIDNGLDQTEKRAKFLETSMIIAGHVGQLASGMIGNLISIDIKTKPSDISSSLTKLIQNLSKTKSIIFFDDLERCTIPLENLLGFINNLIEHCEYKAIIISDENNIGLAFSKVNLENKYLSLLSGGRKLVRELTPKQPQGQTQPTYTSVEEMTLESLNSLNSYVYSENYKYKDIKEKVIGLTISYFPSIEMIISDTIDRTNDDGVTSSAPSYKSYLLENKKKLVSCFENSKTANYRITWQWIKLFEKIYDKIQGTYLGEKRADKLIEYCIQYSISVCCSMGNGNKIVPPNQAIETIGFSAHQSYCFLFIYHWFVNHFWDQKLFNKTCKCFFEILKKDDDEAKLAELSQRLTDTFEMLKDWKYLPDKEIEEKIETLISEIKENKISYIHYQAIIIIVILLEKHKIIYSSKAKEVADSLLASIDSRYAIQKYDNWPPYFDDKESKARFSELYGPIDKRIRETNNTLSKEQACSDGIYDTSDSFETYCNEHENYFYHSHSFFNNLDKKGFYSLIKKSDLYGKYQIINSIANVMRTGNLNDFFIDDLDDFVDFKKHIKDEEIFNHDITSQLCQDKYTEVINDIIRRIDSHYYYNNIDSENNGANNIDSKNVGA